MDTVFDGPQWTFKIPTDTAEPGLALIEILLVGETKDIAVEVVAPSELFKFYREVLKAPTMEHVQLLLEKEEDRWYLVAFFNGNYWDLWYYTKSTLPMWANQ